MTTFMRPVPPTDMQLVLHKGGWRVSVSPTLVVRFDYGGPCRRLNSNLIITAVVLRRLELFLLVARSSHIKLATTK